MKFKDKDKSKDQKDSSIGGNELEQLRLQIDSLQKEKDEIFGKLQRVSADYTNFQKRIPKQIADTICYEREKIIKTLLPILDNFEHSLQNASSTESTETILKGVQIIYDQMIELLKSHGTEQIKAQGEKFDPALHQALMQKTEPDQEENIVLEELQKGYKLNGRVIRPTRVSVNKLPSPPTEQQELQTGEKSQQETPEEKPSDEFETKDTEDTE